MMDELYNDWTRIEAPVKMCHSKKTPRQEILWVNYRTEETSGCQLGESQERPEQMTLQESFITERLAHLCLLRPRVAQLETVLYQIPSQAVSTSSLAEIQRSGKSLPERKPQQR